MIERIISWSTHNRFFVWLGIIMIVIGGVYSIRETPVDALPDLSENQVIIFTEWMGRNPQIMEDQVTYPLVSNLQGIPKIKTIRAASMFGMSFIFVIFEDDAEIYWARTRVLERLNYAQKFLPSGITPSLGPDGTGVGHVFWYTLQGEDYNLGELRAVQDWYVKFALQNVQGVSEVASFGGFQKQYQVTIDPHKLIYYNVPLMDVAKAVINNNRDVGGSLYEMNSMGYMIKGVGYIKTIEDIREISVGMYNSVPVRLKDVADVQMGSDLRLGIVDENGEGERVGGIVVMRYGENAKDVIERVKERIATVEKGLPPGVKFSVAYDRSDLINASIQTLSDALWQEILIVAFVVVLFLFHIRSGLVAIICILLSVLIGFILMKIFGVTSNIMSLGGIALAIGDVVDPGIVMAENAYRSLADRVLGKKPEPGKKERIGNTREISEEERVEVIEKSSARIGRSVFFSVIIMIISFAPILFLTGQEKKLFTPLVLTKTFSLMGAALLAILVAPMLARLFVKGRLTPESRNPVSNFFVRVYTPVIRLCQRFKYLTLAICVVIVLGSIPFVLNLGTEFMPPLDEGSLLLMPVTLPDVSNTEAKRIIQIQDKIIKGFPEVENILGKAGRAYTATDNAPMAMIESIIVLKPKSQWREGMTKEKLISEMNEKIRIPGVVVGWTQPIINRINMLSTGIRTDVGLKVFGGNLDTLYSLTSRMEKSLRGIDGLADLYLEQLTGGKYLNIIIKRSEIARYGLSIEDVNMVIEAALGGMNLTNTVEGRERFTVSVRLAQDFRNDLSEIRRTPVQTAQYGNVPLSSVADIKITEGPPMINSENAMLRGTVLFNVRGRDMGSVVNEAKAKIEQEFSQMPQGYYVQWSGQYENQVRAQQRLMIIIPITLLIIAFILYMTFGSFREVVIVLVSIPFALIGGVYSLYFFGVNFSVAVAVGFTALFGVAAETGVLMISYLNNSIQQLVERKKEDAAPTTQADLKLAIFEGAVPRVRPLLMTVLANIFGLLPVLVSTGTGSDVMKPITIPFVFGLISSTIFVLVVLPVFYQIVKERELKKHGRLNVLDINE